MERVCEPELMDGPSQAQAYAEADFSASDDAFSAHALALLAHRQRGPTGAEAADAGLGADAGFGAGAGLGAGAGCGNRPPLRILDLGCGPGNISFRLARACPHARVLGLDGAAAMLAIARERLQAEPALAERLSFRCARLPLAPTELEALGNGFDLLVSNSLLHHLHDPQALWRPLRQLAAPGAWLVLRDLRRPADAAAVAALLERHAANASAQLRHDFEASLRAAFRLEEVRQQLRVAGLNSLRLAERQDRYLDVWGPLAGAAPEG